MTTRLSPTGTRPARSAVTSLLLALALLLGQLGLSAHAVDHSLHPDAPACQLCVHAHIGGGVPAAAATRVPDTGTPRPQVADQTALPFVPVAGYSARAPPL